MSRCKMCETISLYQLQKDYEKNKFKKPSWQREDCWNRTKKEEFKKTILEKGSKGEEQIEGSIILYNIEGSVDKYINDGLQRTFNSLLVYNSLCKEFNQVRAEEIMSNIKIYVQHMEYKDEKEARDGFRRINNGTDLSTSEQTKTILSELEPYDVWNKELFEKIHSSLFAGTSNFSIKPAKTRKRISDRLRSDYNLFYRFLIKDKNANTYTTSIKDINNEKKDKILESLLVRELKNKTLQPSIDEFNKFDKYIIDTTAFIKEIWESVDKTDDSWGSEMMLPTESSYRWCLHLGLYIRFNNISQHKFGKWLYKFFTVSKGRTKYPSIDGKSATTFSSNQLGSLNSIQESINFYLDESFVGKRKKKKTDQLPAGYSNAHVEPFSRSEPNSSQKTIPISSIQNKSEGVNKIPKETIDEFNKKRRGNINYEQSIY